jgi:CrcB protein
VEPLDPDVSSLGTPAPSRLSVVLVVAVGGAIGSLGRAGLAEAMPHRPAEWPWATLVTNLTGSAALVVLLVVLTKRFPHVQYARPFLGTGLLGGYTTFSTFSVEVVELARADREWLALAYVGASIAGMLLVGLGTLVLVRRWSR